MKRKFFTKTKIIVIASLIILAVVIGVVQNNASSKALLDSAQTTTIQKGEIQLVSIATGKIASSDEASIKLTGTVSNLFVELGDVVAKGDVLGEYIKQSVVAQDLYSPVSGVITKLPSALDNQFEIADTNVVSMDVLVSESLINKVVLGQYAEVYVSALDQTFYGSVKSKSTAKNTSGQYLIVVELTNQSAPLVVGMSGVAKLNIESYGDYYYHGMVSYGNARVIDVEGTMLSTSVELGQSVKAKQKLGEYQARSMNVSIIASADGIVSKLPSTVSNELVISNPNALELVVNISETDIHKLELNQGAVINVEAIDQSFEGSVVRIGQIGNTALDYTTYPVTIAFDGLDTPLFLGMSGSATIIVESKTDILVVPYEALITDGTNRYVLSADWLQNSNQDQSEYYIPVTTGIADLYTIQVIGDNLEGQEIVIPQSESSFSLFMRP